MTAEVGSPAGLRDVEQVFRRQLDTGRQPGAALAVYQHGKLVLDLSGGIADTQQGVPVETNTMFVLFSSTKPLASMSVHKLIERGQIGLDDRVAGVWPGFEQHGKSAVTVRHILTHRGGFPETPSSLHWSQWGDWNGVVRAMEGATPKYAPGTTSAYHALNHGWVCAEIVRRVDGRAFPDFLRAEILEPLGMNDTYVGLPADLEGRVAKLHVMEDVDEAGCGTVRTFNRPEVHEAVVPAGCGISTARDLARFYAMLVGGGELDGVRVFTPQTVACATAVEIDDDRDAALNVPIRRGLGFNLGGIPEWSARMGTSSTARTFGHGGAGTSICWGDPDLDAAMVFIPNGFRADVRNRERLEEISNAVRAALA